MPFGAADVIVADGFSGNVLLKTMEGTAMFMSDMMKQMFYRNPLTMLGALLCKKGINGIRKTMDYRETGGSIVIGISRPVIKAHGSSDDAAIRGDDPAGHPRGRERLSPARKFVPISGR